MPPQSAIPKSVAFVPYGLHETMDKRRRRLRPDLYLEETASNSATRVAAPAPTANAPAKSGFGGPKPTSVGVAPAYGFGGPRPGGCAVPAPGAARPAGAEPSRPRASSLKAIVHAPCTRSDVPVVRNLRRGSAADAVASLHRLGAAALEADLHKDKVAKTSVAPAESVWKTWQGFHRDVFGSTEDALPITPQKLVSVGSMFKAGGYRSFPNYATGAKNAHIEAKHHWCQLLEHTRAWVTRSVSRGIGPSRQSCCWSFHKLLTMLQSPAPLSKGGPQHPVRFALLATIFILREIEASTAVLSSWTLDDEALELAWKLPATKTDHLALGVTRSLPCLCGITSLCCPYHLAVDHVKWLTGSVHFVGPTTPLFPTVDGRVSEKACVVETFEALGVLAGQPLHDDTGMRLFGGHTARITGAQTWTAHGVEVNKTRILARHSGDTILRYVAEAPLRTLRSDLGLPPIGSSAAYVFGGGANARGDAALKSRIAKLERTMEALRGEVQTQSQDVVALATGYARTDDRVFVQNEITACVHVARSWDQNLTTCGWQYATARRVNGAGYRTLNTLANLPESMLRTLLDHRACHRLKCACSRIER